MVSNKLICISSQSTARQLLQPNLARKMNAARLLLGERNKVIMTMVGLRYMISCGNI